ncbi:ABC transporter ATP-binding protein [Salinibacterium sp. G-O1]|uniref:dipeptide ABC transporter ATP-binding protein n=1 Tax=Salinibacterium sp. G-O1 TaxID=3046208 RepID=UPI0024B9490A|nr:ABC transporter ATP-binding protein [Salinibacterium sp. G-O1]MDJ0336403.1 ABC transporter ATP-binding protein [Salinibacterium sp. G-O1]
MNDTAPVLEVENLVTTFHTGEGPVNAVRGVSFSLRAGETMALVGESGSGKSVTALSLLNMVRRPGRVEEGRVLFHGVDLLGMSENELRSIRGKSISVVFQDPTGSLNPLMKVRDQLVETILAHRPIGRAAAEEEAIELMVQVGIPDPHARLADYPLAFSGGMSQRVMIAIALANNPEVIIADEPTTALDVTIQAQILELLVTLNKERGTSVILITHNLGIVARVCDRIAVMYAGKIVEEGETSVVFSSPKHPYTRDLLGATPRLDHPRDRELVAIKGRPPTLRTPIQGCSYAARDPLAFDRCFVQSPELLRDGEGHAHACFLTEHGESLPPRPESILLPLTQAQHSQTPLLEVTNLVKEYPAGGRTLFGKYRKSLHAVDGVSFRINIGETVGLVGESGCGKSTIAKLILGIEEPTAGSITYEGVETGHLGARARRDFNKNVQLIFQNPMSSLNPRMTVGAAVAEPLRVRGASPADVQQRVAELLEMVGMDPSVGERYPHEFSGGQRQRIVIARALAVDPRLIVCDEAVAALDVSLQAQVINLIRELQMKLGLSYLFIGHDIATVRHVASRIMVMYLGEVVESGPSEEITARPLHPYTASLLSAVPEPDPEVEASRERIILTGEVPTPLNPPSACRFHTRCPIGPLFREDRSVCATEKPELRTVGDGREVACHFPGELLVGPSEADLAEKRLAAGSELGPVRRVQRAS